MSIPYELVVTEDLNLGWGPVNVSMPAGGTAVGQKIGLHTFTDKYSVTDGPNAAMGDDTTLDTEAFEDALDRGDHIYVPPGVYKVGSFTIDQDKTIEFARGAMVHVIDGQTITCHGTWMAGHWQTILSTNISTTAPPVLFSSVGIANDYISAAWFGCVGDSLTGADGTDNSTPLQQAFIAATNLTVNHTRNGVRLIIPPGRYRHASTLYILPTQAGVLEVPGAQTQSSYGFSIEGVVGGKMDLGASIITSAVMHTGLFYSGSGAGTDVVGIQVGDPSGTYAAIGGVFKNLWFATTSGRQVRAGVRAFMTSSTFDTCAFSGQGTSISAGVYVDCGLRLSGFTNTVYNCSFNDTYGGLWFDQGNGCGVYDSAFVATRAAGCYVTGGNMRIVGNTFQDNVGAAVAADMSVLPGSIIGVLIKENYLENNLAGTGGHFDIGGRALNDTAKGVSIEGNTLNSVGDTAPGYIRFIMTDGCKVGHNYYPDYPPSGGLVQPLITVGYDASGNTNLTLEKIGKRIVLGSSPTTFTDLQSCQNTYTNGGMAGALTIVIPRGVSGVTFGPVYKTANQNIVLDGAGGGTIDGAATLTNSTAGDTGKAGIMLECLDVDVWVTKHKTGTWA